MREANPEQDDMKLFEKWYDVSGTPEVTVSGGSQEICGGGDAAPQEAKNWLNPPLNEKFHRGILKGVRNISDTL